MFDFDGTLVDTAPDLVRATNVYLKSKGIDELSEARIRSEIGNGLRRLILDLYPAEVRDESLKQQIEQEFIATYEKEYLISPRPFEGVIDFLHDFPGKVAIVSNKRERFIKPILKQLGMDIFPWVRVVGGDTYNNMKPHPEPFLKVMEAAGVAPHDALIVGDGSPDIEGALAVGCRSVAVEFGYSSIDELKSLGAWRSIASFDELLPLINSIT